jgi:hypothetical protein
VSVGSSDGASSAGVTASNAAGPDHLLELAERSVPFASNVVLGRIPSERDVVWILENEEHLETTLSRRDAMIVARYEVPGNVAKDGFVPWRRR